MDYEFWMMLLQIIIFLPFIIFLIYLSIKFGGGKIQSFQNGKYIKILERVAISKETSILLVKLGDKIWVMSSSSKGIEKLQQLTEEEAINVEKNLKDSTYNYDNLKKVLDKLKLKGRFKNE